MILPSFPTTQLNNLNHNLNPIPLLNSGTSRGGPHLDQFNVDAWAALMCTVRGAASARPTGVAVLARWYLLVWDQQVALLSGFFLLAFRQQQQEEVSVCLSYKFLFG